MTTFIDSLLTCTKLWCILLTLSLYVGIVPNVTLEVTSVTTPPTPATISLEILLPSVGVTSLLILAVALVLTCVLIKQRVAAKYSL